MRIQARLAALALIVLTVSPVGTAAEVVQPTPAPESAPLEELDEVVVRGKRLMDEIVEAEAEFYKLFNELNKDDRYDTHCVYLQMQGDSRLQNRTCIPGFVADAMADWAPYKARCQPPMESEYGRDGPEFACLDRNNDGRLSMEEASARSELASAFMEIDQEGNGDGSLSGEEFTTAMESRTDLSAPAVYMPPTPDSVLVNGTKKWYDHMTAVVKSDPRLNKMADHLGDLYFELGQAQVRFDELDLAAKKKVTRPSGGATGELALRGLPTSERIPQPDLPSSRAGVQIGIQHRVPEARGLAIEVVISRADRPVIAERRGDAGAQHPSGIRAARLTLQKAQRSHGPGQQRHSDIHVAEIKPDATFQRESAIDRPGAEQRHGWPLRSQVERGRGSIVLDEVS